MVALLPSAPTTVVDPLPLPQNWGVTEALLAVTEAQPDLPMTLSHPQVVAALSTVVLRAGGFAVKVYPPGTDAPRLAGIAAALTGSQTAVLPAITPVTTDHGVVVVYPWHDPNAAAVDWPAIGALARDFHREHAAADVPRWVPLRRLDAQLTHVPTQVAEVFRRARTELLSALDRLTSVLGIGVIHGDVSPSNALATTEGLRFIDLDFVARGPLEYDLAGAARRLRNGRLDAETYRDFCDAYGFDVRSWEGTPLLDRLAELGGLAFAIWDHRQRGADLSWLASAAGEWATPL